MKATEVLALLPALAAERPIFHSEIDFQLALAWLIQRSRPEARIRLEVNLGGRRYVDIQIDEGTGERLFIELKYPKARWSGTLGSEHYDLREGARDLDSHGFVKDVVRLESFVQEHPGATGLALLLTNDRRHWTAPAGGRRPTIAAEFELVEGTRLEGTRSWGPRTGAGTLARIEASLSLAGSYECHWDDYSAVPGGTGSETFRYLALAV